MKNRVLLIVIASFIICMQVSLLTFADTQDSDLTLPRSMVMSENNLSVVKKAPKYTLSVVVFPETANQGVKWTSSDSKVCSVDSNGKLTARKVGYASITATSVANSNVKATCYVNVVDPTNPIVEFNSIKEDYNVVVNRRVKLQYEIKPSNASNKYIKFTVEDKDVCSVDSNGYVSGISEGDTTVTATTDDGGFTLDFYITVSKANNATYDAFSDLYPNLKVNSARNVDEGIWMDIDGIGTAFYDNYKGEFTKGWLVTEGSQYYFEDVTTKIWEDSSNTNSDDENNGQVETSYTFPLMKKGWLLANQDWVYLKDNGAMANNEWIRSNDKWYLLDKDGLLIKSGEKYIGSNRYLFSDSGEAVVGFRTVDGIIKHYNQDTCSLDISNWFKEPDGRWYYADQDGSIAKNRYIKSADGLKEYYVDVNGVMLVNTNSPDGRYAEDDGHLN